MRQPRRNSAKGHVAWVRVWRANQLLGNSRRQSRNRGSRRPNRPLKFEPTARGDLTLSGLDGRDTLEGGAGLDTLIGGAYNDTYVLKPPLGLDNHHLDSHHNTP